MKTARFCCLKIPVLFVVELVYVAIKKNPKIPNSRALCSCMEAQWHRPNPGIHVSGIPERWRKQCCSMKDVLVQILRSGNWDENWSDF